MLILLGLTPLSASVTVKLTVGFVLLVTWLSVGELITMAGAVVSFTCYFSIVPSVALVSLIVVLFPALSVALIVTGK